MFDYKCQNCFSVQFHFLSYCSLSKYAYVQICTNYKYIQICTNYSLVSDVSRRVLILAKAVIFNTFDLVSCEITNLESWWLVLSYFSHFTSITFFRLKVFQFFCRSTVKRKINNWWNIFRKKAKLIMVFLNKLGILWYE